MAARKRASKRPSKRNAPPRKALPGEPLDAQEIEELAAKGAEAIKEMQAIVRESRVEDGHIESSEQVDAYVSSLLTESPEALIRRAIANVVHTGDPLGVALLRGFTESLDDDVEEKGARSKPAKRSKTRKRPKR